MTIMSDNKELAGKVAVVTGAGRNIGRAIALALADAGAAVVVNVRSNAEEAGKVVAEIKAAGGKAVSVIGDVADPQTAHGLAAAAEQNFGRMSAHIGSKHRAHVMTAKAALVGFSRALAHDLAADKITANCVVPGAIDTSRPSSSPKPAHHLTHGTISGERGKPEDVAAMVRFLAGPGGRNVTGQTLHVNAGAYLGS